MIFISLKQLLNNVGEELSSSISKIYFNNIVDNWKCQDIGTDIEKTGTFCESFWIDDDKNKRGMGIVSVRNESLVFLCSIPIGSEYYDWNSCSEEYA